uniref:Uncharacterized protein n=1 Tax=Ralstonia solanacearum TaxID=305 RepID=A0A0S4WER1_RALSL|nr:protein of unknown function [Ralstonia solanacearum]
MRFEGGHRRTAKVDAQRTYARCDRRNGDLESDSLSRSSVQTAARPTWNFTHAFTRKRSIGQNPSSGNVFLTSSGSSPKHRFAGDSFSGYGFSTSRSPVRI